MPLLLLHNTISQHVLLVVTSITLTFTAIRPQIEPIYGTGTGPGYSLTVVITSHPFGASVIEIDIETANGYRDYARVRTEGGPSWTFDVPPNQGGSVRVCVDAGFFYMPRCDAFTASGNDMVVRMSSGGE